MQNLLNVNCLEHYRCFYIGGKPPVSFLLVFKLGKSSRVLCPNRIRQFKDVQRAKAEPSQSAREGWREAAAFTVSHESLQPTDLDFCHACSPSFFLAFSLRLSIYSMPGQSH